MGERFAIFVRRVVGWVEVDGDCVIGIGIHR